MRESISPGTKKQVNYRGGVISFYRGFLSDSTIKENSMETWECTVCGYVYDPAENNRVPFKNLPGEYTCPECGAALDMFSELT
jgi:rubredoxin